MSLLFCVVYLALGYCSLATTFYIASAISQYFDTKSNYSPCMDCVAYQPDREIKYAFTNDCFIFNNNLVCMNRIKDIFNITGMQVLSINNEMLALPDVEVPFCLINGIVVSFLKNRYTVYKKHNSFRCDFQLRIGDNVFAYEKDGKTCLIPMIDEIVTEFHKENCGCD
jgi:hypothetical protein